jgi:hypothetical protein
MKLTSLGLLVPLALASCVETSTSCFVAGTLIATPQGPIPIEALVIGDSVWSFSLERGEKIARRVRAVLRSMANEVRVIAAGGNVIAGVTPEHPFYDIERREYRAVRDLIAGDALAVLTYDGISRRTIASVTAKEIAEPSIPVFNLTIDGPEANYFAAGILVHNKQFPVDDCVRETVEITEHEGDAGHSERGKYDVTWSVLPPSRIITIHRVVPGAEDALQATSVEHLGNNVDHVRLLHPPQAGSYEVRASAELIKGGTYCVVRDVLAFSIAMSSADLRR